MKYEDGKVGGSTPSVKPKHGNYGGGFNSTPSSDKMGGFGAPPGRRVAGKFKTNPKQKSFSSGRPHNTVRSGDPGNKGM